ncbi:MAG TPA: trimeric intracellular cation channel family protein [Clostridia bacterium]
MFLLNAFEIIGTIAFAISGALIAIRKQLDLFGVIFLAVITAVGGGVFRDLLIGTTPPTAFRNPAACFISIATALLVFLLYNEKLSKLEKIVTISDALGLGVFTAIGCRTVLLHNVEGAFAVVFMGMCTGVGGGIIRDVLVNDIPFVLKKEIYAVASIIGGLCYYLIRQYFSDVISLYVCCLVVFAIRLIAIRFNINLPIKNDKMFIRLFK